MVVDYLESNSDEFEPYIEDGHSMAEYCDHMRNASVWGGEIEMVVLSRIFKRQVIVHRHDTEDASDCRILSQCGSEEDPALHLRWSGNGDSGHYDLLYPPSKMAALAFAQDIVYDILNESVGIIDPRPQKGVYCQQAELAEGALTAEEQRQNDEKLATFFAGGSRFKILNEEQLQGDYMYK